MILKLQSWLITPLKIQWLKNGELRGRTTDASFTLIYIIYTSCENTKAHQISFLVTLIKRWQNIS